MGQHDDDRQDSGMRRILLVCGAAVLAVTGGGLGGYVVRALADPGQETVAAEVADASEALQQEREKLQQLERQLAVTLKHIAAQADLVAQAASQSEELVELRKALDEERQRPEAPAVDSAELQQERAKAEGLARDLAGARREIDAQSAAVAGAGEQADEARKTVERTAAELRGQIAEERTKAEGLARDLEAARRENEGLTATLRIASAKAADTSRLDELEQALRQSEGQRESLVQALRTQTAAALPKPQLVSVGTIAVREAPPAAPTPEPVPPDAETLRLMARGQQLVEQRNILAARQMLERATETGHPEALFALAETYDPNRLAAWRTVGTQGDVARARALYGKALAGGVAEADACLKALP